MIRICSDGPIQKDEPVTGLLVTGWRVPFTLSVPTSELKGGDGFVLQVEGAFVKVAREGAPTWELDRNDSTITLEIRRAVAHRPPSRMFALIEWDPGKERRNLIQWTHSQWEDGDLLAAGSAMRFLTGIFPTTGRPKKDGRLDRLAQAGLKWLRGQTFAVVEDVGRRQMAEAMGDDGLSRVNGMMERRPTIKNADIHRRMHEILKSGPP